jgi:hypothetical protein
VLSAKGCTILIPGNHEYKADQFGRQQEAPPPAVIGAILDALHPLGITHVDMPATPNKIWQAIHKANSAKAAAE